MDSVTQLALGAAIGHATLGSRVGRRALVWGGVLGTLPDLDLLIPMGDAVADFTYHRSWSHSLFVLSALTPLFAGLAVRLHPSTGGHRAGWRWLVWLVFITHVLLDCFTVYGTQIFWPLAWRPEMWSSVFIIDPLYTVPLVLGGAGAWLWSRRRPGRARWVNVAGLALSTVYLAWTMVAKLEVEAVVARQLAREGVENARVLTTPTPLNSLLWRVVVMRQDGYAEGFYSLVADGNQCELVGYRSEEGLLEGLAENPAVQRLDWFTHGFRAVSSVDGDVVITDLRMGSEPDYIFRFRVARLDGDGTARPIASPTAIPSSPNFDVLGRVWSRIWDARAQLR